MIDKIFLDMDGVIVNFRGQCEKYECINGNKVKWEVIHQAGPEFWEEMEWLPEGKELYQWILKLCEQENIDLFILTAVHFTDGKIGKLNWLKNNTKIDRHHIIITNTGNEKAYYADQNSVLIDDYRKNCEAFAGGGGQFVKYETPRQTKDDLVALLGKN
jgi:5'(3')-deoxyribonucleotidase